MRQVKYLEFIEIYTQLDDNEMREYQERSLSAGDKQDEWIARALVEWGD